MKVLILSTLLFTLGACSSSDNDDDTNDGGNTNPPEVFSYKVDLINLTNAQPLSPPAAILQNTAFSAWSVGSSASNELELLAESGDASGLLATQTGTATHASMDVLAPGKSLSFEITSDDAAKTHLTVASMLVNTNDAFTGFTNVDVASMQKGESRVFLTHAYNAGTEFDDESSSHIPGPVAGGEGFNAARDDVISVVTLHGGVVGQNDGNPDSVLTEANRFDNPVMRVEVTRL